MISIYQELNKFNHISFEESAHVYFSGDQQLTSVTTLLGQYKHPFEKERIAKAYALKHGYENYEDVIAEWDEKNEISRYRGSELHKYIEYKLAGKIYQVDETICSPVLTYLFDRFYEKTKNVLIPVRSELIVGDIELGIAGMLDQLYWNMKHQELQIWDWKSNKEIKYLSPYGNRMKGCLSDLHDCEIYTYSLQLGIYKRIIEKNTNIRIGRTYICWLNECNNEAEVIETMKLDRYLDMLLTK
jgi:hypothetical protein